MSILLILLLLPLLAGWGFPARAEGALDRTRGVRVTCAISVREVEGRVRTATAWLPIPRPSGGQRVEEITVEEGYASVIEADLKTGNTFLRVALPPDVKRLRVHFDLASAAGAGQPDPELPAPALHSVLYVPPGSGGRQPEAALPPPAAPDLAEVRRLFLEQDTAGPLAFVPPGEVRHLRWHAGFIEVLQERGVPARFATGLVLPEGGGGRAAIRHWAEFRLPDRGWTPVSVLLGDGWGSALVLSVGRDVRPPGAASDPRPFFDRPLVELDGMVHHDVETDWTARPGGRPRAMMARNTGR